MELLKTKRNFSAFFVGFAATLLSKIDIVSAQAVKISNSFGIGTGFIENRNIITLRHVEEGISTFTGAASDSVVKLSWEKTDVTNIGEGIRLVKIILSPNEVSDLDHRNIFLTGSKLNGTQDINTYLGSKLKAIVESKNPDLATKELGCGDSGGPVYIQNEGSIEGEVIGLLSSYTYQKSGKLCISLRTFDEKVIRLCQDTNGNKISEMLESDLKIITPEQPELVFFGLFAIIIVCCIAYFLNASKLNSKT